MSFPANTPQLPMHDKQSEIVSPMEHQSFKRPRDWETIPNLKRPLLINRPLPLIPYKTQLCSQFRRGNCSYGDSCHFAHGDRERREILPKQGCLVRNWDENNTIIAKMRLCRKFCNGEECPYGNRCHFLHEGLEKIKGNLGLPRKNCAINIEATGNEGNCRSGSDGSERFVKWNDLNPNQVYQKQVVWKTRLCNKWETTGNCPYGLKCYFAHGSEELQKLATHTALQSGNVPTPKTFAKDASSSKTEPATAAEKQGVQDKKWLFKWTEVEKISRIYADWVDNMPLMRVSSGKVGS